jgi:hypothetical protein
MSVIQKYVPGVCNIDSKGRKMRAAFGIVAIVISMSLSLFLQSWAISPYWQLLIVLPLWAGFNGLWQARYSFCVGNAAKQQFEIGGKIEKITGTEDIAKDKKKAMQINAYSLVSAILLSIALFAISSMLR